MNLYLKFNLRIYLYYTNYYIIILYFLIFNPKKYQENINIIYAYFFSTRYVITFYRFSILYGRYKNM